MEVAEGVPTVKTWELVCTLAKGHILLHVTISPFTCPSIRVVTEYHEVSGTTPGLGEGEVNRALSLPSKSSLSSLR